MSYDEIEQPLAGDSFISSEAPHTVKRIFRVDEVIRTRGHYVVTDNQNGRWVIGPVKDWTVGPRFIAIRPLNPVPAA